MIVFFVVKMKRYQLLQIIQIIRELFGAFDVEKVV